MKDMKKVLSYCAVLAGALFFQACEETGANYLFPPDRDIWTTSYNRTDTQVAEQPKGILIEDFTGVNCQNCPKAADELHRLVDAHSGRIVPVGIHAKPYNFTAPVNKSGKKSKYDFRNDDAERIYDMIQVDGQLPKGSVDRGKYDFSETLYYGYLDWNTAVQERLDRPNPVNITISEVFRSSEQLVFKVVTYYHEAVENPNYITVYVTENDIKDYQLDGRDYIKDYHHEHVLRQVATANADGDLLAESMSKGDVFIQIYTIDINPGTEGEEFGTAWNADNLVVAAFVHEKGGLNVVHAVDFDFQ